MAEKTLAVLFADISGSTKLYETEGDRVARDLTAHAIEDMSACVVAVGGWVIKTIGDEIMAAFPTAAAAYDAALAMQAKVRTPFSIRIGFHFGPVIEENGDVFGDTVNIAARVTGIATAGETILTESVFQALSPDARATARFLDSATLKGKALPVRIYKIVLEAEDATFVDPADFATPVHERQLMVVYAGNTYSVKAGGETLTIGRSPDSVMAVQEPCVSRAHAKIYNMNGKFFISDHSTNGSYVVAEGGESSFIKRETVQLGLRGAVYLGTPPVDDYSGVITFSTVE